MNLLKYASFIEGSSLLILLFIAMPLKYIAGDPRAVHVIGMIHGVLFLILGVLILFTALRYHWRKSLVVFALITSTVPFGMFALDRKLKSEGMSSR